jgi:uncharacterized membrane protein YcaP (DUF421 family)
MWDTVGRIIGDLVGGDAPRESMQLAQVGLRAALVYLSALALVRVGKSRFMSQASAIDVVLVFILGSVMSRGITGSASISATLVASAVLVLFHFCLTRLACRYHGVGSLVKGHARVLVEQGQIDRRGLNQSHLSEADLHEAMRLRAGTDDLADIKTAYKERSGAVSIIKYTPDARVVEVTVAEGVQTVRIVIGGEH